MKNVPSDATTFIRETKIRVKIAIDSSRAKYCKGCEAIKSGESNRTQCHEFISACTKRKQEMWHSTRDIFIFRMRPIVGLFSHGDVPEDLFSFANKYIDRIFFGKNKHKGFDPHEEMSILFDKVKAGVIVHPEKKKCSECGMKVWPSRIYKRKPGDKNNGKCMKCVKGEDYKELPPQKTGDIIPLAKFKPRIKRPFNSNRNTKGSNGSGFSGERTNYGGKNQSPGFRGSSSTGNNQQSKILRKGFGPSKTASR